MGARLLQFLRPLQRGRRDQYTCDWSELRALSRSAYPVLDRSHLKFWLLRCGGQNSWTRQRRSPRVEWATRPSGRLRMSIAPPPLLSAACVRLPTACDRAMCRRTWRAAVLHCVKNGSSREREFTPYGGRKVDRLPMLQQRGRSSRDLTLNHREYPHTSHVIDDLRRRPDAHHDLVRRRV